MNYIKQLNAFYNLLSNNPLSPNAQCLYNYLLSKDNELLWIEEFTISNIMICAFTGLSRQALDRARNELKTKGYIDYQKGISNQAGKYSIIDLVGEESLCVSFDTQNDTQDDKQSGHTVTTLNKLKTKNIKHKKRNNKEKQLTELDNVLNEKIQDEEIKNAFYDFIEMRKTINKPLTKRGLELAVEKLYKLSQSKEEQLAIINKSIMNNWQGLFALNDEDKKQLQQNKQEEFIEIDTSQLTQEEYGKLVRKEITIQELIEKGRINV